MNDVTRYDPALPATAIELRQHVNRVQEAMREVMKEGTHFGTIPGTPKPSLWKPGAEVLCLTFRIAPAFEVEQLARGRNEVAYRVTCTGVHQGTGVTLGSGLGEASTAEEKYAWRRAVCKEEFDATPFEDRRVKYAKGQNNSHYTVEQIRTNPADIANTVLKMACKRALVAMTLNTTAASDIFTQDIEDLPAGVDAAEVEGRRPRATKAKTAAPRSTGNGAAPVETKAGESKAAPVDTGGVITASALALVHKKLDQAGLGSEDLLRQFEFKALELIPFAKVNDVLDWIARNAP